MDQKICAACRYWCRGYAEPRNDQTNGYCCWREMEGKRRPPNVNRGSWFELSEDGVTLRTAWDTSCIQWQPK